MNIAVTGATGTMGRAVLAAAGDREDLTVALAVNREPTEDRVEGIRIDHASDLPSLLAERRPNALIDFTGPSSSVEYVQAAADAAVPAVVGTTGFSDTQRESLRAASDTVPVLHAANFARGVQALLRALDEAVSALPDYDIELTDTHHNRKRDAPSGTAGTILDRIATHRGDADIVHGRAGDQPRTNGEIGVHARRAGDIRGEHELLLAGNGEVLTLTHRAINRRVFAEGALDAAVWLAGQPPGWYDFADVLDA